MYSSCSVTCGEGEQSRSRQCEGGICSLAIPEDLIEIRSCNVQDCAAAIQIQASECNSWDIYVQSGEYVAIGSTDNHQVYKRATNGANGMRWYFVFSASEDRWFFYLKHNDWGAPGPLDHALPGFCQIKINS